MADISAKPIESLTQDLDEFHLETQSVQESAADDFNLPDLNRFPDIFEQVFDYLDFKDLCNASLVSSSWNEFIGDSKLMKKISICIDLSKESSGGIGNVLSNSKRKFKSVKIKSFLKPCDDLILPGFIEKHKWSEIILDCQAVPFPEVSPDCLANVIRIEANSFNFNFIQNLLSSAHRLKVLKLKLSSVEKSDWEKLCHFQLESLTISLVFGNSYCVRNINNVINSQISNLRSLEVQGITLINATMQMISSMPHLTSLTFNKLFIQMNLSNLKLADMLSLRKLRINDDGASMKKLSYNLLLSAPNLKLLDIPTLNQSWIDHAGFRLKDLEELHVGELSNFYDISSPDLFCSLDQIKIRKQLTSRQISKIANQVEGELTNFKLCLYEETAKKPHVLPEHIFQHYLDASY